MPVGRWCTACAIVLTVGHVACGVVSDPAGEGATEILPVELPALEGMHPSVQMQLRDAHALAGRAANAAERSSAYGTLGTLLMAAEYLEAAEPSLRNARRLSPTEYQWTYYLAHLFKQRGELTRAVEYFELSHEQRPDEFPPLIWLTSTHLTLGQPEDAQSWLAKARALRPGAAVVRFQEGRAASANRDYERAVEHLTAALRMEPDATGVHYPLAMAYRALGNLELTEYHLGLGGAGADGDFEGGVMFGLGDPLLAELTTVLRSPRVHRELALEADARGDWPEAAHQFRLAVEMDPDDALMRVSLAMAYDRSGDARAAWSELQEAIRIDPELAQAHYVMGTLLERSGRDNPAIDRFRAASSHDPSSAEARLRLADALRRAERFEASLTAYRQVLELATESVEARFGEAMALVRLERYREARERLNVMVLQYPREPVFATALARVLATSPDDHVRDGRRALELINGVVEAHKTTAVAETMAMVLAELGEFRGAVEWQQVAIDVARDAGRPDLAEQMSVNFVRYTRGEPCRIPWRDDEPEQRPGPVVDLALLGPGPLPLPGL
ncbi:MAG: tetratricopeptide repeat protein [Acidobacteriota bacterium]|nr:tetratricopeptide repeat protein [Acidobacteriota bacterium]